MPRNSSPAVELPDVRSWEVAELPPYVYYRYNVTARPGFATCTASVALVWEPVKGVCFVLRAEGETLNRGRPEDITGAWIRSAARLNSHIDGVRTLELIKQAKWNLDAALPTIRA